MVDAEGLQQVIGSSHIVPVEGRGALAIDVVDARDAEAHIARDGEAFLLGFQGGDPVTQGRDILLQGVDIHAEVRQLLLEGLGESLQSLHSVVELLELVDLVAQRLNIAARLLIGTCSRLRRLLDAVLELLDAAIHRLQALVDVIVGARNRLCKLSAGHGAVRAESPIGVALDDAIAHQLLDRLISPVTRRYITRLGKGEACNQAQPSCNCK